MGKQAMRGVQSRGKLRKVARPRSVAREVRFLIAQTGGEKGAEAATGVARANLWRLAKAKAPSIRDENARKLVGWFEQHAPDRAAVLNAALSGTPSSGQQRRYYRWCQERADSLFVDRVAVVENQGGYYVDHGRSALARHHRRVEAFAVLREVFATGAADRFVTRWVRMGIGWPRIAVAFLRAVEPLLASCDTAFVEPHWSEFSSAARREIVTLGLRREDRILRVRRSDGHRLKLVQRGFMPLCESSDPGVSTGQADTLEQVSMLIDLIRERREAGMSWEAAALHHWLPTPE